MIRFLINMLIYFAAAAIGLVVANLILDDMALNGMAFFVAAAIFAVTQALLTPLVTKGAKRKAPALMSGVGLITTFVALIVTDLLSDGLSISGASTWLFASLIVWLATMLASAILPLFVAKEAVEKRRND